MSSAAKEWARCEREARTIRAEIEVLQERLREVLSDQERAGDVLSYEANRGGVKLYQVGSEQYVIVTADDDYITEIALVSPEQEGTP